MKSINRFLAIVLLVSPAFGVKAQSPSPQPPEAPSPSTSEEASWDRLSWLSDEKTVTVSANGRTVRCQNIHADDQHLSCDSTSVWYPTERFWFARSEIQEVRQRRDKRNFWITVGTAAAAGGIFASVNYTPFSGYTKGYEVVGSALGLGAGAAIFVYPVVHFLPGKLLYRQMEQAPGHLSQLLRKRTFRGPMAESEAGQ